MRCFLSSNFASAIKKPRLSVRQQKAICSVPLFPLAAELLIISLQREPCRVYFSKRRWIANQGVARFFCFQTPARLDSTASEDSSSSIAIKQSSYPLAHGVSHVFSWILIHSWWFTEKSVEKHVAITVKWSLFNVNRVAFTFLNLTREVVRSFTFRHLDFIDNEDSSRKQSN